MASDRPNVLIVIPHDLGDHLRCYGHASVASPNLDRMAEEGVRFTSYFATAPECTCSRGGMMTGLYAHQNGLLGLAGWGWEIRPGVRHLARRFADGGYRTHLFGLQHETGRDPRALGYQVARSAQNRAAPAVCRDFTDFLGSGEASEGPWLACLGFSDVHRPWAEKTTFSPAKVDVPPYLPDNSVVREELAHFHQSVLNMDREVGRILDALKKTHVGDNTLVVFTTDHGIGMPRAKATYYDPGIRIPLILHWPERFEYGREYGELLSNLDLTPTLAEICGIAVPETLEGRSFAPLLRGDDFDQRDAVCGSVFYDVSYDPMHMVRTRTHKYIRSFAVATEDRAGADPDSLCTFSAGQWVRLDDYDVMSRASWRSIENPGSPPPKEELYDLRSDPNEFTNLADDPSAARELEAMRARTSAMMERTNSPLLHGHVPPTETQKERGALHRPGGPKYH